MPGGHAGADGAAAVISDAPCEEAEGGVRETVRPWRPADGEAGGGGRKSGFMGMGARREAACASADAWAHERDHGAAGPVPAGTSRPAGSGRGDRAAVVRASTERCRIGPYRGPPWPRCRQAGASSAPGPRCQCSPRRSRRSGPRPRSRSLNGSAWVAAGSDGARPSVSERAPVPARTGREIRRRCCRAARGATRTEAAWAGPCGRGRRAPVRGAGEREVCRGRSSRAPDRRKSCHARRETG